VAPVDRCPKRPLAGRGVPGAGAEHVQCLSEPVAQLVRIEQRHARSGQLDGQREPIEAAADLGHRARVDLRELEASVVAAGALDEQGAGRGLRHGGRPGPDRDLERADRVGVLGLESQSLPAGHEHGQRTSGAQ
jgi:hypothetical protein